MANKIDQLGGFIIAVKNELDHLCDENFTGENFTRDTYPELAWKRMHQILAGELIELDYINKWTQNDWYIDGGDK